MIRTPLILAAMVATLAAPVAAQRVFPVADKPEMTDHFPVQPVLFPKGVKAYRDVIYQQLPGYTPQVVDIYVPATKGPHPLVLYIHGGGWTGGHTRHSGALANFPAVLASLAAEGFTVASLEYRLSGEAKFPAQLQDAKASLRFLGDNAARYRIDPSRVGIWGGSAGGHLTALTALTCKDTSLDPAAAKDVCATAAVTWYGVFDFGALAAGRADATDNAAERLMDCNGRCSAETYALASPNTGADALASRAAAVRISSHVPVDRPELAFVYANARQAMSTLDRVATVGTYAGTTAYPTSGLGQALKAVAGSMVRGIGTRVFYVTTGGYDTHANQGVNQANGTYATNMATVGDALLAFHNDLARQVR